MTFNEDTRVKIPTILHLNRLGYEYLSLKELEWDKDTNIALPIFYDCLKRLNPDKDQSQLESFYKDLINMANSPQLS